MRNYMPGPHRRFLELIARISNIQSFVLAQEADSDIRISYNKTVSMLAQVRQIHINMATRYITIPATRQRHTYCQENHEEAETFRGTGGTEFLPFLKDIRDDTKAAIRHGSKLSRQLSEQYTFA